jgi:hypothetical protein
MANIRPVTAALPSPILIGLFMALFITSSQIIAQAMEKVKTASAGAPNFDIPISTAGTAARIML